MEIYALEFLEGDTVKIYLTKTLSIIKEIDNERFRELRNEITHTRENFYYRTSKNSKPHWADSGRGRVPEVINSRLESLIRIILSEEQKIKK
jgi:hypothetical protein